MEVLILGAICLYSVSACIWVAWEGLNGGERIRATINCLQGGRG